MILPWKPKRMRQDAPPLHHRRLMMQTHAFQWHQMVGGGHELRNAQRARAPDAGWLEVVSGRAWITRDGGGDDHVLGAG
jgi:Protein of unknown function (DUF2917)